MLPSSPTDPGAPARDHDPDAGSRIEKIPARPSERRGADATLLSTGGRLLALAPMPSASVDDRLSNDDDVTRPQSAEQDDLSKTCEVTLAEMECIEPTPNPFHEEDSRQLPPEWLRDDRSFATTIVGTALVAMLALVLVVAWEPSSDAAMTRPAPKAHDAAPARSASAPTVAPASRAAGQRAELRPSDATGLAPSVAAPRPAKMAKKVAKKHGKRRAKKGQKGARS